MSPLPLPSAEPARTSPTPPPLPAAVPPPVRPAAARTPAGPRAQDPFPVLAALRIGWKCFFWAFLIATLMRFTGTAPRPVVRAWDVVVSALIPGEIRSVDSQDWDPGDETAGDGIDGAPPETPRRG